MTNPTNPHLEAHLQHDLDEIRAKVLEMAALDEKALTRVLKSLLLRDRQLAYSVILRDKYVDELESELDKLCLEFILRHQPVGSHLRFVYSASKIVKELERIGDYAESIGRQVLQLSSMAYTIPTDTYAEIGNQAIPMLHNAVRAFIDRNPDLARTTMANQAHVRRLRDAIDQDLEQWRREGRIPDDAHVPLSTVSRRFERVMEQAMNICEEAIYFSTGEYAKHIAQDSFRIVFVDDSNTCASQIAEAIGRSLRQPRLTFTSAGLAPGVLDPQTIRFLEERGIDISGAVPASLADLPSPEQTQVVVALSKDAERAFSAVAPRALRLTWFVQDPSRVAGTPEAVRAAYTRTFEDLSNHIRDLAQAILGDDKETNHG